MARRDPTPKPKRLVVTLPQHCGPHVKLVFAEMRRQGFTYDELGWRSGVPRPTLKAWRQKNAPSLQNIEAALGALGFDLVPIPRGSVLPSEVTAELKPIAERLGLSMPDTIRFLFEIVCNVHDDAVLGATSDARARYRNPLQRKRDSLQEAAA